jgi:hypothetical protein
LTTSSASGSRYKQYHNVHRSLKKDAPTPWDGTDISEYEQKDSRIAVFAAPRNGDVGILEAGVSGRLAVVAVEGRKNVVRLRRPPIDMMQSAQDSLCGPRLL